LMVWYLGRTLSLSISQNSSTFGGGEMNCD
jgi:hypothetical protein